MCGIAGALFLSGAPRDVTADEAVRRMVNALGHRGPDGRGVTMCQTPEQAGSRGAAVALGHTRLAIIDLSDRAAQPMTSRTARTYLTYNGEVYNFREIRRELEALGRSFQSDSDTEVILQGYEVWGERVLDKLRGMFAFAIWDGAAQRLFLARDGVGIKPLYFYRREGVLLFASEVRALLASGLVPRRLDATALEQFLAYQTVPTPRTLVEHVRMLRPGAFATVSAGQTDLVERPYWDLLGDAAAEALEADDATARSRVGDLLAESAALHFVSDVPVGIFLSGGIDSSALVGLTRRAGITPRTFCVVMPGTPHDEAAFARVVAERFRSEHSEFALREEDLLADLPEALARVDHPSGDGLNTYIVSRAVRSAGLKVALSGLGGDELFGGYPSFRRLGHLARYRTALRRSPAPLRAAAAAAVRAVGGGSVAAAKAAAVLESDGSVAQAFPVLRQLFAPAARQALLGRRASDGPGGAADPYVALLEEAASRHREAGWMSLVSHAEARTYMHDVLLRDTDQMSMAHGLEVRVPLLDRRLVEYVMGLRDDVKDPRGTPKRLLVESLGTDLPAECVQRPKRGFVLPLDGWMKGGLRSFCEHHLGPDGLGKRGVFDRTALASLWGTFLAGNRRTSWSRPWTLVALDAWLEANGIAS